MKNHTISICVGVLAAFAVAGCGGVSEKDVIGSWTGNVVYAESSGDDQISKAIQDVAAVYPDLMSFELELREDNTFTMDRFFVTEGRWELDGDVLTLTTEKVSGLSIDDPGIAGVLGGHTAGYGPIVLRVSKFGKTMTGDDPNPDATETLTFKRD